MTTTTLILLPGLACDAALWRDQLPALAEIVAVRVANQHFRFYTLPAMATALLAEQPGQLLLAGASMGGMLALEVWRQAPQRVRGLALLGTSARPDTPELIALRTQACELFAEGRVDEVLRPNLMLAFAPGVSARSPLAADYLAMMARAGPEQLIRQNRAVMARADSRALLPTITCPTLVLCGQADALASPEYSREMAAAIPNAQLHWLPDCGHMLTWEQAGAVTALLRDWAGRAVHTELRSKA